MIRRPIITIASVKTRVTIIVIQILGAEVGLRPKALIEAYPVAAITADGPRIAATTIRITVKLFTKISLFHQGHKLIPVHLSNAPSNGYGLFPVNDNFPFHQKADDGFMML
jgi:hypothetical protein